MFFILSCLAQSNLIKVATNGSATEYCSQDVICSYDNAFKQVKKSDTLFFVDNYLTMEDSHKILDFYATHALPMKFIGSNTVFVGNESEIYLINTTQVVEIRDVTFRAVNLKIDSTSSSVTFVNVNLIRTNFNLFDENPIINALESSVVLENVTLFKINGSLINIVGNSLSISRTAFKEVYNIQPFITSFKSSLKLTKIDYDGIDFSNTFIDQRFSSIHLSNMKFSNTVFNDTIIKSSDASALIKKIYLSNVTALNPTIFFMGLNLQILTFSRSNFTNVIPKLNRSRLIDLNSASINIENIRYESNSFSFGEFKNCNGVISNSVFQENNLSGTHSLVNISSSSITVKSDEFTSNRGKYGTAISFHGSSATIKNCNFSHNFAKKNGGSVSSINTHLTVTDTYFINNTAVNGGAVYIKGSEKTEISTTKFDRNVANYGYDIFAKGNGTISLDIALPDDNLLVTDDVKVEKPIEIIESEIETSSTQNFDGKLLGDIIDDNPAKDNAAAVIGSLSILMIAGCAVAAFISRKYGRSRLLKLGKYK
ncbi:hypothetical protein TVAG_079180 [Trichomonas vaginalis G3]|uniref:Right handed beta helix domain-containing protein n=1 Tax=Trichomonas vaginalis (strain ATCC PRA-98 / G3) TaxID=412133 RepID=A2GCA7_TRIV3|nr:hypothetical protein TVAGG3_0890810 [Trichomonas vaginalis G3]EAX85212.1 hypothetical protein TVAG_079180 [Trichomonas vaginalis G3]KAI5502711.1 hypothetical protein TVAGG3_0890810 [Trichomonas vaginalis G3]|eukprot:XP_001298142.1 hypothetical protein [Trichomonas vaginalis G3]